MSRLSVDLEGPEPPPPLGLILGIVALLALTLGVAIGQGSLTLRPEGAAQTCAALAQSALPGEAVTLAPWPPGAERDRFLAARTGGVEIGWLERAIPPAAGSEAGRDDLYLCVTGPDGRHQSFHWFRPPA